METSVSGARDAGCSRLDLSPVTGSWISATGLAGGVLGVRTRQHEGILLVEASGYGEPGPWGEAAVDGVFADSITSAASCAFIVTFDRDQQSSQLQAYIAFGLLTVHAFHRPADGRRDYFTRECYVPDGLGTGFAGQPAASEFPAVLRTGGNAPSGLAGTWACLVPAATMRLRALQCKATGSGGLEVRAQSAGRGEPADWGTAEARLYADATRPGEPPAFLATFDHGYMRVYLQARINRGILVVCEFTEFTDGSGRSSYFIRESFRR